MTIDVGAADLGRELPGVGVDALIPAEATPTQSGLMSSADKAKLDNLAADYVNATGDTMSGGLGFGSATVATATDLSRHLALYGTTYGFSVTGSNLNYNSGFNHSFYSGGTLTLQITGTALTYKGSTVWHSGNDGTGSGLDADLLDGVDASQFVRTDAASTMTTTLTMQGSGPMIKFNDIDAGAYDFWVHANSNTFYVLHDTNNDGSWEATYPLRLDSGASKGYVYGNEIFDCGSNQTIANAARKTILTDTSVGQAGASNFMFQSNANGGNAIVTFHSPSAFACNFGMASTGDFYKGGWSLGTGNAYRFWDEKNVPLGDITDIQGSNGSYKLFTGAALELRMSQWRAQANADTPGIIAGMAVGSVGSYAFAKTSTTVNPGSTIAGSSLLYSNSGGATIAGALPGTWRCMGYSISPHVTLWLRIA